MNSEQFIQKLHTFTSDEKKKGYEKSFAAVENDEFIGVQMGKIFAFAKENIDMELSEIEKLLESPIHEVRVGAVSIMDFQARSKKFDEKRKKELFDLYLRRHDRINSWDLVDRSANYVVGFYLYDKPRDILYSLARSSHAMERRTAIVSTAFFIKKGGTSDTFKLAEILIHDKEDLVHKAVGWMLRAAGGKELIEFLDKHAAQMTRVMLRYSIEHLDKGMKERYLKKK